ncbi:MAG TPA: hypothetical protein P5282_10255, partial [Anaerolineaceae bacterium]|nr:hypothetical protein [Anaerolineaceae bacterium]
MVAKAMEKRWRFSISIINASRKSAAAGVPGKESTRTDAKAGEQGTARKMTKMPNATPSAASPLVWLAVIGLFTFTLLLVLARPAAAQVSPQFGFEYYGGSNKLRTLTPWGGVRFSLSPKASFIVRYSYRDMRYDYWGSDGGGGSVLKTKKASLNQFSGTIYFGEKNLTGYVSGAWLTGSEGYKGYVGETGVDWKFHRSLSAIWSIYSIREKSILWHPE